MTNLIEHAWPVAPLGDLVIARYGKALPQANRRGGAVPVYGSNGVVGHHDVALTAGPAIVIGRKGSSGAINFSQAPCFPIDTTYYIDDPGPFTLEFLTLLLRSLNLQELDRSTAVPGLSRDQLYALEVPLPPVPVQAALVRLLLSTRDYGESAMRHLSTARGALERFRRSVLAAACSGRLTTDWRIENPVGENADDLVHQIEAARRQRLGRRFKPVARPTAEDDLPERWTWTTVGALLDVATGATPLRRRADYFGGSIPWVTSGAANAGDITHASEFITDLAIKETNAKVFPSGTLLVAMYGEGQTRGRVGELKIAAATNQAVAALLFDDATQVLRPYVRLFFEENYERIRQLSFGGVQPNLSLGVIRDTPIPLPPIDEQAEVVRRVRDLLSLGAGINARIDTAARRVEHSSQALLAKGFRGELISVGEV